MPEEVTKASTGAKCTHCGRFMLRANGCNEVEVPILRGRTKIKTLAPIKYGGETRYGSDWRAQATGRCHDCGCLPGQFHHPGCDVEECPNCHTQLLMCGAQCGGRS